MTTDLVRTVSERIASEEMAVKIRGAVGNRDLANRIQRAALTALQTNPELLSGQVTQTSVYTALLRCAQDGLLPDGREASFVRRGKEIVYQPMVGGFRKRAAEQGFSLTAQVVYAGDEFDYTLGLSPTLIHKPPKLDIERGDPIGAYAIAHHPDHGSFLEVMSRGEIEQVRKASAMGNATKGPWAEWWGEMARKTVARRLFKQLPLGAGESTRRAEAMLEADEIAFGPFADLPQIDPAAEPDDVVDGEAVEEGAEQSHFPIPEGAKA